MLSLSNAMPARSDRSARECFRAAMMRVESSTRVYFLMMYLEKGSLVAWTAWPCASRRQVVFLGKCLMMSASEFWRVFGSLGLVIVLLICLVF